VENEEGLRSVPRPPWPSEICARMVAACSMGCRSPHSSCRQHVRDRIGALVGAGHGYVYRKPAKAWRDTTVLGVGPWGRILPAFDSFARYNGKGKCKRFTLFLALYKST
jgi:hypothetical protein